MNGNVCRILIVDPDSDWLDFAVRTLMAQGFSAQGVIDIGEAERASKVASGPQLVLLGLEFAERMPDRLEHFARCGDRHIVVLFPIGATPHRMSRIFRLWWISHSSPSSISDTFCQTSGKPIRVGHFGSR